MRPSELLDKPIAFHRCFAALGGSVSAGLMLSQAFYWTKRTKATGGWFWKTAEEWQEETYLTRTEQATARKQLRQLPCWQEELRGVPAKLYFRLDLDLLDELLLGLQDEGIKPSSSQESDNPVFRNPANKDAGILETFLLAETTSENTSKKRSKSVAKAPSRNVNYDCFAKAYEAKFNYPYQSKSSDFIQYNKWKKIDLERTDEALFEKAVLNYLASPQGKHTFADLVTRFAVFRNSALDRFGKPVESRNPPTPGSAAPLPPQGCDRCVQGWVMPGTPDNQTSYAKKCDCQKGA
jgi:hypothetical protein